MFIPNTLYKKYKRNHRVHLISKVVRFINFPHLKGGVLALKILNFGFLFPRHLKSFYQTLNKLLKKKSTILIFAFPTGSLTKKPTGARMGKGKGKILSTWVCKIRAGFILCEVHTKFFALAIAALKLVKKKLPISSKIIVNK